MLEHIRILPRGDKVWHAKLIYRASRDGWEPKDFHDRCDEQGATLTVIRTDSGKLAAGFTSVPWETPTLYDVLRFNCDKTDPSARLFALTNQLQVFRPGNEKFATRHSKQIGPMFSQALLVAGPIMNQKDCGMCKTGN